MEGEHSMPVYNLKEVVDVNVLQEIQDGFAESTGFAAVTVDYTGKPITKYSNFSDFCKLVRQQGKCLQDCHKSDAHGGLEAARRGTPYIYRCHSGLVDFAIPIIVNEQYLGSIMAGQTKIKENDINELDDIMKLTKGLLENPDIGEAYKKIPEVPYEKIVAAAQLMYTVSNYIVEKGMITLIQEELNNKNLELMEELKVRNELEKALKDSEIKALQSQINPHFLFNVLNNIGSLALMENAERTQELIYLLSEMLRYMVKNINLTISVEEEIKQIERYLKLQSVRYGDKIDYKISIDENVKKIIIPSMIIQPFVENAIVHGIEPKEEKGCIRINGFAHEEYIVFEIEDDGVGMDKKCLREIFELNSSNYSESKSTGIGISNANRRIIYTYGSSYKVDIKSKLGFGTKVIIKLPKDLLEAALTFN